MKCIIDTQEIISQQIITEMKRKCNTYYHQYIVERI